MNLTSYETPKEQPSSDDAKWVETLECDEGFVAEDVACEWFGKINVTGRIDWQVHKDGSQDIDGEIYDWTCPECGHKYHVNTFERTK